MHHRRPRACALALALAAATAAAALLLAGAASAQGAPPGAPCAAPPGVWSPTYVFYNGQAAVNFTSECWMAVYKA